MGVVEGQIGPNQPTFVDLLINGRLGGGRVGFARFSLFDNQELYRTVQRLKQRGRDSLVEPTKIPIGWLVVGGWWLVGGGKWWVMM